MCICLRFMLVFSCVISTGTGNSLTQSKSEKINHLQQRSSLFEGLALVEQDGGEGSAGSSWRDQFKCDQSRERNMKFTVKTATFAGQFCVGDLACCCITNSVPFVGGNLEGVVEVWSY